MRRIIIIVALLGMVCLGAKSQTLAYQSGSTSVNRWLNSSHLLNPPSYSGLTFGPKIGLTYARLQTDHDQLTTAYQPGYQLGAFMRYNFLDQVYIQPEVYFSSKRSELTVASPTHFGYRPGNYKVTLHNIDLPFLVGFTPIHKDVFNLRLFAGPLASFNVNGRGLGNFKEGEKAKDFYLPASWGYQAGIGIDWGVFSLDGRYESGFSSVTDFGSAGLGKPKIGLFQASLGIKLL